MKHIFAGKLVVCSKDITFSLDETVRSISDFRYYTKVSIKHNGGILTDHLYTFRGEVMKIYDYIRIIWAVLMGCAPIILISLMFGYGYVFEISFFISMGFILVVSFYILLVSFIISVWKGE